MAAAGAFYFCFRLRTVIISFHIAVAVVASSFELRPLNEFCRFALTCVNLLFFFFEISINSKSKQREPIS